MGDLVLGSPAGVVADAQSRLSGQGSAREMACRRHGELAERVRCPEQAIGVRFDSRTERCRSSQYADESDAMCSTG